MTNHEKYQRAFSTLHPSRQWNMEGTEMKQTRKRYLPRAAVVCAAVILVLALAATAYAADIGGIQRTIQIWMHGDQTDAVLNIEGGEYSLTYTDENGEQHEQFGGGKAFDIFGRERDVTEEEIREYLDMPDVEYRNDGSVWVYYHDHKIEITDKFDDDGVCYVKVSDGGKTYYVTVKYENGHGISEKKFISPDMFN